MSGPAVGDPPFGDGGPGTPGSRARPSAGASVTFWVTGQGSGSGRGMSAEDYDIEHQGDLQYVVRLDDEEESVEAWFRLTPDALAQLGVPDGEEADLVAATVDFLRRHQDVADFPSMVEIEDVLASYPEFEEAVTTRR